ncbi:MAG: helix-turn-helix domain-containing protein [Candidatus Thermoplasmatota archaeon]|nr:helix-turn-helix domain-containing protein [Candidatus Thermoplasmatota archaeon]
MTNNDDLLELDRILSVLENPIRRKILQKLSREINYPLQLSKELNVSQQAIMKHLKVLEDNDFVISYDERSDKGGAPRKVYVPRKRYCVRIDIGPNTYHEEYYSFKEYDVRKNEGETVGRPNDTTVEFGGRVTGEMKNEVAGALPAFTDPILENYRMRLEKAINTDEDHLKLMILKRLISNLNDDIDRIESRRKRLLALRERAFEDVNHIISDLSKDYLEKEILSLYIKSQVIDVDIISDILDTRKKYVEEVLKHILSKYEI